MGGRSVTDACVLFLPTRPSDGYRWLKVGGGAIAARGDGVPTDLDGLPHIVIVSGEHVALHWAVLPDRSAAQSVAAARATLADAVASPIGDLHVAVGREGDSADRPIALVDARWMQAWLDELAAHSIDADAIIPGPMLLPRPVEGFVKADLGIETVVRGAAIGFVDEPKLTGLVTGGIEPAMLDVDALEEAILQAVATPPLNLRQGAFAPRRPGVGVDWGQIKRLGWLAMTAILLTVGITLVDILRNNLGADSLDRQAESLARQGLRSGETVNDADRQLDERLLGLRGPGLGFTRTAGAVFTALRAVPASQATALSFDGTGSLRVSIATQGEGAANDVKRRIEAMGFTVTQTGQFVASAGRVTGDFQVVPQ